MVGEPYRKPQRSGPRSATRGWNWLIVNQGQLGAGAGLHAGQGEWNSHEESYAREVCESNLASSSYAPAKEKPSNNQVILKRAFWGLQGFQFNWRLSKEIIQLSCAGVCTMITKSRESTAKTHWGWHLPSNESMGIHLGSGLTKISLLPYIGHYDLNDQAT